MREREINELILQIFEEQEELFYFPIFSQKDAKAFVKALNGKGLGYEKLCDDIGESEHSFNSWRKSLGRTGVGQRVIERINQPFLDLLEEDADQLMKGTSVCNNQNQTPTKHQNGCQNGYSPKLSPVRPKRESPSLHKNENENELAERLNRARNRLQESSKKEKKQDDEKDGSEEEVFSSSSASQTSLGSPKLRRDERNAEKERPISQIEEVRMKLRRSSGNVDAKLKDYERRGSLRDKDNEGGVIESRNSVHGLLQKFENIADTKRQSTSVSPVDSGSKSNSEENINEVSQKNEVRGQRSPSPSLKFKSPSSSLMSNRSSQSPEQELTPMKESESEKRKSESSERRRQIEKRESESRERRSESNEKSEIAQKRHESASSQKRHEIEDSQKRSESESSQKRHEIEDSQKRSESESSQKRHESEDSQKKSENESSQKRHESEGSQKRSESESSQKRSESEGSQKRSESEGSQKRSESESSDKKSESETSQKKSESENNHKRNESESIEAVDADSFVTANGSHVKEEEYCSFEEDQETSIVNHNDTHEDETIQLEMETPASPHRESLKEKEERLAEAVKAEVSDIRSKIREQMEAARKRKAANERKTPLNNKSDVDIDENYNSDLDPDNEDQSPVMSKLVQKISSMRSTTKNGPGHLYVFADSFDECPKVKIGTSKFPDKRLQQAQVFNPDLFKVMGEPISQRITALEDLAASLAEYAEPETKYWYRCNLDTVIAAAQETASKFVPKNDTQNEESVC